MSFTFEITDEYNVKIIEKNNTSNKSNIKYIEVDDLLEILKASKTITNKRKENKILLKTPVFTSFKDISTLNYIIIDNKEQYIVLKKEAGTHDFAFKNDIYHNMHLPTLIFTFKIFKGMIVKGYVCCSTDIIITEKSQMYYYPFGNVYLDTHICFGSNNMANHKITEFSQLHSMPNRFLLMPTSDSYTQRSKYKLDSKELCEYLIENEFDNSMLIPIDMNFDEYTNKIINY